jgi:hypothetical protein
VAIAAAEPSHLLDGRVYVGNNGEIGREADRSDEFIFKNGQFVSASCDEYQFASGPYTAWLEGNIIYFEAVTLSQSDGKISWQGKIDGDNLNATFVWTKERWYWDTRREYWFKGKLQQ